MADISRVALEQALVDLGSTRSRRIIVHRSIDSTSSDLRRRLKGGELPGTIVAASVQTGGRGRQGRDWCSSHEGNLYLSLSVALSGPYRDTVPMLPLAAGIAAHEAVRVTSGLVPELKWPNDVLVSGRKLGGLLSEAVSLEPRRAVAIVGLGVNVSQCRFPKAIEEIATSIALEQGRLPRIETIAARFVSELEARIPAIEGVQRKAIVDDWLGRAEPFGRRVRVGDIEGMTRGLSSDGRLIVVTPRNERVLVAGGVVEPAV